jgi:hypothetical protein
MTQKALASLDRVAIGLSGLCAIHCVATPAAVILFPVLSACLGSDERFHALLLVLVVPSSVVALTLGCRRHRDVWVLGLGTAGLGLLVVGVALGHVEYWERPMTLGATALIVMAHARNYRLCRRDGCEH